jgi:hypothetical protein
MRAAIDNLARDFDVGLKRVEAGFLATAGRNSPECSTQRRIGLVLWRVPVARPPATPRQVILSKRSGSRKIIIFDFIFAPFFFLRRALKRSGLFFSYAFLP